MNRKSSEADPLEERLRSLRTIATPDHGLTDDVLRRIESLPQPTAHHPSRMILRISLGLAAIILIGLIGFFTLTDSATPTYAQVTQALSEVKTVHAFGRLFYGDIQTATTEIWYQRGVALKLVSAKNSGSSLTIFSDGKQAIYIQDDGPKYGPRLATIQPAEEDNDSMLAKEMNLDGLRQRVQPDPRQDREIGGVRCRAYVWARRPWRRITFWIGSDNWVRRMQFDDVDPKSGKTSPSEIMDITYNVPIDPEILKMPRVDSR